MDQPGHTDLDAARRGDDDAFGRIYDRHAPIVLALCRRRSPGDAEDAMQETFIRAHAKLDEVDGPDRLPAWLYAIARHVCSERNRARRRRDHHEGHAMTTTLPLKPVSAAAPDGADRAERLDRLSEAMDQLSDEERLALHLHYLDKDPVRAASQSLGLSRSGYYKLLTRARANLSQIMTKEARTA